MIQRLHPVWALFFLIGLASCSASGPMPSPPHSATLEGTQWPLAVVHDVMLAELALDRHDPQTGLTLYVEAALQSRNTSIAQRATEVALRWASPAEALPVAEIWAQEAANLSAQSTLLGLYVFTDQSQAAQEPLARLMAHPNSEESMALLQGVYEDLTQLQHQPTMVHVLEQAWSAHPEWPGVAAVLAEHHLMQGSLPEALAITQRATASHPNQATLHILHTEVLRLSQQPEKALAYLERYLAQHPEHSTELKLYQTRIYLHAYNQPEAAKAVLLSFQDHKQIANDLHVELAMLALEGGFPDVAEHHLLALKNSVYRDYALYVLAKMKEEALLWEEAYAYYLQVGPGEYEFLARLQAIHLLMQHDQSDQALSLVSQLHAHSAEEQKLKVLLQVELHTQLGQDEAAHAQLSTLLAHEPNNLQYRYLRSLLSEHLGWLDQAQNDLETVLELAPEQPFALNALGIFLATHTQEHARAEGYLRQALALSPNDPTLMDSMGWLLFQQGKLSEAQDWLAQAHDLHANPVTAAHYGEVLWHLGLKHEAHQIWQQALNEHPNHPTLEDTLKRFALP